ncbi:MAG: right-handed parallel beta-helix repeat-containing protein, partial [Coleofasciculus chthonoplastes F3-SA18-01]|uniref:right-handed parallel beta-helix repeat-containing protein n=1 Tax=Coleofasciculus chthonoplastes TaxID=64178 RepID=UPI003304998F
ISIDTVSGSFDISDSTITITNPTSNGIFATTIQGSARISANQGSQVTTTTANAGILLAESLGTINLTGLEVNSTNGAAIVGTTINNATISDSTLTSINSSTNGISLNGISGIVDISNSTITITNPLDNINGISVSNVTGTVNIAANEGSQITQANQGIELFDATGAIAISGFEIQNTDDSGIYGINLGNVTLAHNRIESATNEGIYIADTEGEVTINNNTIIDTIPVPNPDASINFYFPTGRGIMLENVKGTVNIIANNITGTDGLPADTVQLPFVGTIETLPSGQGVMINNVTGFVNITISENELYDNFQDAILIGLGIALDNPLITGNPTVNLIIEGNTIENNGGTNPIRGDGVGIGLEGGTTIENMTISGNEIRNNGDEGIDIRLGLVKLLNSTAQIQQAIIEDNTIENNRQQGIEFQLFDETKVFANILENTLTTPNDSIGVKVTTDNKSAFCLNLSDNTSNTGFTLIQDPTNSQDPQPLSIFEILSETQNILDANQSGTITLDTPNGLPCP